MRAIATSLVTLGFDESIVRAVSRILASGRERALERMLVASVVPLFAFAVLVAGLTWMLAPHMAERLRANEGDATLLTSLAA